MRRFGVRSPLLLAGALLTLVGSCASRSTSSGMDNKTFTPACYRAKLPPSDKKTPQRPPTTPEQEAALQDYGVKTSEALQSVRAGLTWCYETEMRRTGPFNGHAIMTLALRADGTVQGFELSGYSPPRLHFEICMARYACAVTYPKQPLGEDVTVEQEFNLTPVKAPPPIKAATTSNITSAS